MYDTGAGIYVHIPFCVRKCIYCDFLSFQDKEQYIAPYFNALYREISSKSEDKTTGSLKYNSVFIGGGTPSIADPGFIKETLRILRNSFDIDKNSEITIEANPGTLNEEKLSAYREAGINRISIGVQSVTDRLLRSLGRIHDFETAYENILLTKKHFDNINLDFISAIPKILDSDEQSLEEALSCVRFAWENDIPHVSVYSIITEEETKLQKLISENKAREISEEKERLIYHSVRKFLEDKGYEQYEISNFARPGYSSLHNKKYWECLPYVGFGLGSASYLPYNETYRRMSVNSDLKSYSDGDCSCSVTETLDLDAQKKEFMLLGFRMIKGPDSIRYHDRFGTYFEDDFHLSLEKLIKSGYIDVNNTLTVKGLDYANCIFREFL